MASAKHTDNGNALPRPRAGEPSGRCLRLIIVLAGIFIGQLVLFAPSLAARKILLPLDILKAPGVYLPTDPVAPAYSPENIYLSDLVYLFEPSRRFAVEEYRSGRIPAWAPYQYAGAPFMGPKFSPYFLLQCTTASPVTLAWSQMAIALVAGLGAYAFCRRVLGLAFLPSAMAAWCYPLTGFFTFWQGYPTSWPVSWLAWVLLSTHQTIHTRGSLAPISLAAFSALSVISGHPDVAAQVLLAAGLFAIWLLFTSWRAVYRGERDAAQAKPTYQKQLLAAAAKLSGAWALALVIASPYLLPIAEYSSGSARMSRRAGGEEERPPTGIKALPQVVLPDLYGEFGIMKTGSFRYTEDSQQESSAAGYAGLVAALFLAPVALVRREQRAMAAVLWLAFILGMAWQLNIPGVVNLMRLPGVKLLSHNRFVFLSGFALTVLAALGLHNIKEGCPGWRGWMWLPWGAAAVLLCWCVYRTSFHPEPLATEISQVLESGRRAGWIRDVHSLELVRSGFTRNFAISAALAFITIAFWATLKLRPADMARGTPLVIAVILLELLWNASGRSVQSDPALYYPRIPVLERMAGEGARAMGYRCLPANLASMSGLVDPRGYDGVDPADVIDLLKLAAEPGVNLGYAFTQWLSPAYQFTREGVLKVHPVLDMLAVRYVLFRQQPPSGAKVAKQGSDYWICENPSALPRVYFPSRVKKVGTDQEALESLASPDFQPRELCVTRESLRFDQACRGTAKISRERSTEVEIEAHCESPGVLVLADRYDAGWKASVNGKPAPVLRVNHALRGVVLEAGDSRVIYQYEPVGWRLGMTLAGFGLTGLATWAAIVLRRTKAKPNS